MPSKLIFPKVVPKAIRRIILEQAMRAHVGHIGSALSIADIIAALFSGKLESQNWGEPDFASRDRFILSKGHAALALYAALHLQGRLDKKTLDSYCGNGGYLGVHPEKELQGIDFSSGSLGQGLSMGVGAALAMRLNGLQGRVRVLISDAELNEGSTWEAIMYAAHQKIDNLDVILDMNGQQAIGKTKDILDLSPQIPRWEAFGWDVREANGHDVDALLKALNAMSQSTGKPHVLLAKTICGKGVSFMENQVKWHYWPMSEENYTMAILELDTIA